MGGDNDLGSLRSLFGLAHKTVTLAPVEAALVGRLAPAISQRHVFHTRRDAFPGRALLGQQGEFAALARPGRIGPQRKFGHTARLLRREFAAGAPQGGTKPAMRAE